MLLVFMYSEDCEKKTIWKWWKCNFIRNAAFSHRLNMLLCNIHYYIKPACLVKRLKVKKEGQSKNDSSCQQDCDILAIVINFLVLDTAGAKRTRGFF